MNTRITFYAFAFALVSASIFGKPVPDNLGNGLHKIVTNNLIGQGKTPAVPTSQTAITAAPAKSTNKYRAKIGDATTTTSAAPTQTFDAYKAMIAKQAASYASRAITDAATGKYLVEVMPNGRVPAATLQSTLQAAYPAMTVQAVDQNYAGHGAIEAYVA